ncbi:unnamed protein product [Mycena citricolor]|uniref:Uncharacterized protein n=1 Tax=Mycena citricolor TaxID=2018698 RepID=A0AAD2GTR3_9AGAR|nr:unnamed protein product [Mycena citricolor]
MILRVCLSASSAPTRTDCAVSPEHALIALGHNWATGSRTTLPSPPSANGKSCLST